MKTVSRKAATHRSGKKKGKLKKGCRFTKGGAVCGVKKTKKRKASKSRRAKVCNPGRCSKKCKGKTKASFKRCLRSCMKKK